MGERAAVAVRAVVCVCSSTCCVFFDCCLLQVIKQLKPTFQSIPMFCTG